MTDERMKVLTLLEEGKITATEAAALLEALNKSKPEPAAPRMDVSAQVTPILERAAQVLDRVPERLGQETLPKVGKGVGRVVELLSGFLNQGIGLLESHLQASYRFEETLTWTEMEGITTFQAQNVHGVIRLIGEERTDVSVNVIATLPGENEEAAREFLAEHPAVLRREGNSLMIAPPSSISQGMAFLRRQRFDFECRVPRHLIPRVSTISGDLVVEGLEYQGDGSLKGISGEIRVRKLGGLIDANTVSGDLLFEDYRGEAQLRTVSGDIELDRVELQGRLATVSGDLEVQGLTLGACSIKSVSGDIDLDLVATHPLTVSSTSGDVEVVLGAGSSGYVDASTRSGDVELGLSLEEPILSKSHARGKLGGGTVAFTVSTISGDLTIR